MLKPVANAAKEILNRPEPRSGASTPGFARTAAEVADTAAKLDKDEPEQDISDGESRKELAFAGCPRPLFLRLLKPPLKSLTALRSLTGNRYLPSAVCTLHDPHLSLTLPVP